MPEQRMRSAVRSTALAQPVVTVSGAMPENSPMVNYVKAVAGSKNYAAGTLTTSRTS